MKSHITQTEMEVLRALWKLKEGPVKAVAMGLKGERAYTTVQTLLRRLEEKGVIECDKSRVPHVYRPNISRAGLVKSRLQALAEELCEGAATPLILALVEDKKLSKKDVETLRRLVEKLDQEDGDHE